MITLITGTPGAGKTAWVVNELLAITQNEQRNVYVHGIRGLKLPHVPIYCKSDLCDLCSSQDKGDNPLMVEDWGDWKQKGDLVIIDEVQRIWRPRSSGSSPPRAISMLETHRHYGIDFWLVSQGPHLFDSFVRALVGRHVHLVANWAGRKQFEWPECKQALQYKGDAVTRPYKLPRRVFKLYSSAELHTKVVRKVPLALYGFIGAVSMVLVLGFYFYQHRIKPAIDAASGTGMTPAASPADGLPGPPQPPPPVSSAPVAAFPDFTPERPGLAESAPAYRHLVQVKAAPLLAGCVRSRTQCRCFTAQATPYNTSEAFCQEVVKGNYFNPYVEHKEPPPVISPAQLEDKQPQNPDGHPSGTDSFQPYIGADNTDIPSHS